MSIALASLSVLGKDEVSVDVNPCSRHVYLVTLYATCSQGTQGIRRRGQCYRIYGAGRLRGRHGHAVGNSALASLLTSLGCSDEHANSLR